MFIRLSVTAYNRLSVTAYNRLSVTAYNRNFNTATTASYFSWQVRRAFSLNLAIFLTLAQFS
jgi:hypothetical protein